MECPYCGGSSRVVDSRPNADGVRRRRECTQCGKRFTTQEQIVLPELRVKKRDGSTQDFRAEKLERAVQRVVPEREMSEERIRGVVRRVEAQLLNWRGNEIRSWDLAMLLLDQLRGLHPLAYRRFLANYTDADGELLPPPDAAEVDEAAADDAEQITLFEVEA